MEFTGKRIYVMGDIHGEVGLVNAYIAKKHPDILIITGDGALFWNHRQQSGYNTPIQGVLSDFAFKELKPQGTKILWLPGNHEAWDYLTAKCGRYSLEPKELKENVYYCPIGSTVTINGKKCLFIGGAKSQDKDRRIDGIDWFADELLTENDFEFISGSVEGPIHTVFSHTLPKACEVETKAQGWQQFYYADKTEDPCRGILQKVLEKYAPKFWFCGHWHLQKGGTVNGCSWQILNTISPGYEHSGRYALDITNIFKETSNDDSSTN